MPNQRVTVNLAPADIKKEGPAYDLPVAISLLAAGGRSRASYLAVAYPMLLALGAVAFERAFDRRGRAWLRAPALAGLVSRWQVEGEGERRLLALVRGHRMKRLLSRMLDEREFLSPYGIRTLSAYHRDHPYVFSCNGVTQRVDYEPAESTTEHFGGNSNWRGPVWFPVNYLLVEALERYHYFYGHEMTIECPVGSGRFMTLDAVARELGRRLGSLFLPDAGGTRPCHGGERRYAVDPHFKDLALFHEYFHGETGQGVGATHQTGWTALAVRFIEDTARARAAGR
jgi:hypothetical protein